MWERMSASFNTSSYVVMMHSNLYGLTLALSEALVNSNFLMTCVYGQGLQTPPQF